MALLLNIFRNCKDWADRELGIVSRFIQFCCVGASGMVFDLSAYKFLLLGSFPVPFARALAIWIALTWNYALNRRLTFHDSHKERILIQYLKFAAGCSLGALVSWSVSVGLVYYSIFFDRYKLVAAFLGILAGTFFNFMISWLWVFRRRKVREMNRCEKT